MLRPLMVVVIAAVSANIASAQVPPDQLMVPPAAAERFVILSGAGRHGSSFLWKGDDGSTLLRESILLRGMVWEQDETVHFGPNGQPDRITIRGLTPTGDAAETFRISDKEARWKSPVDEGSKAYDGQSNYIPQGGTFSAISVLAERLYSAPGRTLPVLPNGEARLAKLIDLIVGSGPTRKTVSAFSLEGLSLNPLPVWLDENGKFFGCVFGLAVLPEPYTGEYLNLQKAQEVALSTRASVLARRFGIRPGTPVAFTDVRSFDADTGRFLEEQTVVVDQDHIVAVGPASSAKVPKNARIIDGHGKTLVPGLWDAHMHMSDDATGPMLLSLGVTSIRNPGTEVTSTIARAQRISKGELLAPSMYSSMMIDGKGPLAAQSAVAVSSAGEAVSAVQTAAAQNFKGVKFYGSMKPEWLAPAIAEAKKAGLHVHGHIPQNMRPTDVIAAGYDEITHINFVMMQAMPDEIVSKSNGIMRFEGIGRYARQVDIGQEPLKSLVARMAEKHIAVDPTLVTFESLFVPENGDLSPAYSPFAGTMPPTTERAFRTGGFAVPKDLTRGDYRASFRKLVELAAALHHAGVPLVAGTDGSGLEIVRELELYVDAGLSPAEALQTATINPARLTGATGTGSIQVGKRADVVLVDGDPSRRIGDLRHTVWVVSEGRLMNADELRAAVGFSGKPH